MAHPPLHALGFTEAEAEVYTALLAGEPTTGYRISQRIGKPTANTYKAIESLERKGAVLVDDGGSRICRALPPEQLIARLEREHRQHCAEALTELQALQSSDHDDRVYRLVDPKQVFEQARRIISEARHIVLGDLFPGPVAALRADFATARERGVRVVLHVYEVPELPEFEWVLSPLGDGALEQWPGQQLTLAADGQQHILALLDADLGHAHQAVWSRSTFLSCMQHNHISAELGHASHLRGRRRLRSEASPEQLEDITIMRSGAPGMQTLQERFGRPTPAPNESSQ